MKWIGLTGGIACGKSAVAAHLRSKGWSVIDADVLAHAALSPGESSYQRVVQFFGSGIVNADKSIDRKALGTIVFADRSKLEYLEQVIHPWVQQQTQKKRKELEDAGATLAFYDVPLLFEKNLHSQFDEVIVVACDEALQVSRLQARNGFSVEEAKRRIAAQMPLLEKIKRTSHVIYNNGTLAELEAATDAVIAKISK